VFVLVTLARAIGSARVSRRLAFAVIGAMVAVPLVPLSIDLFLGIDPAWRAGLAQGLIVAAMGLGARRLLTVRPGDRWVIEPTTMTATAAARWAPWAVRAMAASLAVPLIAMVPPGHLGWSDWDFYLEKAEAVRMTLMDFGQFPWWTPWCRGGFPLASEPQVGVISATTLFSLAFGTSVGVRLAAVLGVMIAVEGTYRLARLWTGEPWSAALAAVLYGMGGAVALSLVTGMFVPMSYGAIPWLLLHGLRLGRGPREGLALGAWVAYGLLTGLQYPLVYGCLLAGFASLRAWAMQPRGERWRVIAGAAMACCVVFALAGWRIVTVGRVMADFPRITAMSWPDSLGELGRSLWGRPRVALLDEIPTGQLHVLFETCAYVGPLALGLAAWGLTRGWRWWHAMAAVGFWLAMGLEHWYVPSAWLRSWPVLATMHIVPRWRLVGLLGLALAASDQVAAMRRSGHRIMRALACVFVLMIAADLLALQWEFLPQAFRIAPTAPEAAPPGPPVGRVVNVEEGLGFVCQRNGYGVVRGYEPVLGYRRDAPTVRLWRGHPSYVGEAWTVPDRIAIEPTVWGPNRIEFEVGPFQEVEINQNPGSWWVVNGLRPFASLRCAETTERFMVRADGAGRLDLRVEPPGLGLAMGLHAAGLAGTIGTLVLSRRRVISS
jgi:hypothetical protein